MGNRRSHLCLWFGAWYCRLFQQQKASWFPAIGRDGSWVKPTPCYGFRPLPGIKHERHFGPRTRSSLFNLKSSPNQVLTNFGGFSFGPAARSFKINAGQAIMWDIFARNWAFLRALQMPSALRPSFACRSMSERRGNARQTVMKIVRRGFSYSDRGNVFQTLFRPRMISYLTFW